MRQVRGAIVRELVHGAAGPERLRGVTGSTSAGFEMAVSGLIDDGLVVEVEDGTFRLAD